jgi:predicted glycosyltransferase
MQKTIVILSYEVEIRFWTEILKNCPHKIIIVQCDLWTYDEGKVFLDGYRKSFDIIVEFGDLLKSRENFGYNRRAFGLALKKDPVLNQGVHSRRVYSVNPNLQIIAFALGHLEYLISCHKPDMIFSYNNQYLVKNYIYESLKSTYNFYCIIPSRIEHKIVVSKSFGHGHQISCPDINLKFLEDLKYNLLEKKQMYQDSRNNFKPTPDFNFFYHEFKNQVIQDTRRFFSKRKPEVMHPIGYSFSKYIAISLYRHYRNLSIVKKWKTSENLEIDFLYFCHVIPEGGGVMNNSIVPDDLWHIKLISSLLPGGKYLYVRENPSMLAFRASSFYRDIEHLPNVKFLSFKEISLDLLIKAEAVIGIGGTNLVESSILGKDVFVMGNPEFFGLEQDFVSALECFLKDPKGQNHTNHILQYISNIKDEVFDLGNLEDIIYKNMLDVRGQDWDVFKDLYL